MDRINLIPERRRLARRRRGRCRVWAASALGYSVLVVAVCFMYRGLGAHADTKALAEELAGLDAELIQIQAEQSAIKPELSEQKLILAAGRSITDQPDWSRLLAYLADEALGDTIVLSGCSLSPAQGQGQAHGLQESPLVVTLKGYAKTTPEVSQFMLRLEESGLFDRVSLKRTNREPYMDGQAIAFEASCLMDNSGGGSNE
jgi:Tfp pilus assembly protein PilN